jgi:heme-degrading monooxygenase HmoA
MILEHAVLNVAEDDREEYEAALRDALPLISATRGFRRLEVRPCVETAGRYLLLVEWDMLEDHTEGFRGSDRYQQWRQMLHRFYDPMPTVEHYGDPVVKTK